MPFSEFVQKKDILKTSLSLRSNTELKRGCLKTREILIDVSKFVLQLLKSFFGKNRSHLGNGKMHHHITGCFLAENIFFLKTFDAKSYLAIL